MSGVEFMTRSGPFEFDIIRLNGYSVKMVRHSLAHAYGETLNQII